jgi:glyoxylate reductase
VLAGCALGASISSGFSAKDSALTTSGLPVPRYVSLKSDHVNVRAGPTKDNDVAWVYTRSGLPVEITAEFENWRRIRDWEGAEGSNVLTADKDWAGWTPTWMLGHRIWGKRLGIIGMGRIGQAVARRARAFGLQIHYHNRRKVAPKIEEELDATYWESLDQMLARMDIVSVNCPHTPATYHLLSARRLKMLRPEAFVVNTSRGEVIDENALARMLEAGEIAGAGLDVFEHEPSVNPKLLKLARAGKVVLLPHMGSATIEGRVDMGEKVIINIKTFMDGHKPPDRVLPSML